MKRSWTLTGLLIMLVCGLTLSVARADSGAATTQPAATPVKEGKSESAADVVDKMMSQIKKNPMIEPEQHPEGSKEPKTSPMLSPTPKVDMDTKALGVAPGMPRPKLRREGEFVINRRGRLLRSPNGRDLLFVFDSDSKQGQDPPMVLVPCQDLQSMEDIIVKQGERVVFELSGQILAYRGTNYLLPTMWKLAPNRGNLRN